MLDPFKNGHVMGGEISYTLGQTEINLSGWVAGNDLFPKEAIQVSVDGRLFGTFTDTKKITDERLRRAVEFGLEALADRERVEAQNLKGSLDNLPG
jgi:hypothetical protein